MKFSFILIFHGRYLAQKVVQFPTILVINVLENDFFNSHTYKKDNLLSNILLLTTEILGRGFKSESASMYMAGAIGGIGLILLVLVLISSAIAKKKNSRRNRDNKEGNID